MQTIGCALTFAAFPALSIGGLGLLLTSVVSAFVVSLVHVSAPVGEDFDAALLEALETHDLWMRMAHQRDSLAIHFT
jgi:hypothetical protein